MQAAHNGVLALALCMQWLLLLLFIGGSQQRTEVQEHSRCMIRARSEHDARPSGNRRSAELDLPGSEPCFVWKNTTLRASAISQKRILYETSFQNAC